MRTIKKGVTTEVTFFNENHPTGLNFPQITRICSTMQIPSTITDDNETGISKSFCFSYILSAIVCEKVGGLTFLSATSEDGLWIWFVILNSANSTGKKYLQNMEKESKKISNDEANHWYELMGI